MLCASTIRILQADGSADVLLRAVLLQMLESLDDAGLPSTRLWDFGPWSESPGGFKVSLSSVCPAVTARSYMPEAPAEQLVSTRRAPLALALTLPSMYTGT